MKTQGEFGLWFTEVNTKPFSWCIKLPLIPKVSPLPNTKKIFFAINNMS